MSHTPKLTISPDGLILCSADEGRGFVSVLSRAVLQNGGIPASQEQMKEIATRYNSHDALVAAVQCVHDEIGSDPCSPLSEHAITLIDAALALAEPKDERKEST